MGKNSSNIKCFTCQHNAVNECEMGQKYFGSRNAKYCKAYVTKEVNTSSYIAKFIAKLAEKKKNDKSDKPKVRMFKDSEVEYFFYV